MKDGRRWPHARLPMENARESAPPLVIQSPLITVLIINTFKSLYFSLRSSYFQTCFKNKAITTTQHTTPLLRIAL
jgi:hypothetical protein